MDIQFSERKAKRKYKNVDALTVAQLKMQFLLYKDRILNVLKSTDQKSIKYKISAFTKNDLFFELVNT